MSNNPEAAFSETSLQTMKNGAARRRTSRQGKTRESFSVYERQSCTAGLRPDRRRAGDESRDMKKPHALLSSKGRGVRKRGGASGRPQKSGRWWGVSLIRRREKRRRATADIVKKSLQILTRRLRLRESSLKGRILEGHLKKSLCGVMRGDGN